MAHKSKTLELADALEKNGDGCTCCAYASFECCCNAVWGSDYTREAAAEIRRLHEENERLRDAVAKEREACAKVCDARVIGDHNREDQEAKRCAAAIRARGEV